jgi:hypothetical protein
LAERQGFDNDTQRALVVVLEEKWLGGRDSNSEPGLFHKLVMARDFWF